MAKVTLKDVAGAAGVGTATAERVMNGRGGVRSETIEKVLGAARRLGYKHAWPEAHRGIVRIEVILVRPETYFYSRLNRAFERIAPTLGHSVSIHRNFGSENSPDDFARYIANPAVRRSALIIVAPDHEKVVSSLRAVAATGLPVVQIMTRPVPELPFVGIDNYAAGRTAAYYMSHMLGGRCGTLVALCHSGAYENHKERIRGFSDYLSAHAAVGHSFNGVLFDLDDEHLAMDRLRAALGADPDIIGVYTAGGDNKGVAAALSAHADRRIFWIGHELTDLTRTFLRNGTMSIVLDQVPEVQTRRSLDLILKNLGLIDAEITTEPVRFLAITPENL